MLIQMIRFVFILVAAISGYRAAIEFGWPGTNVNTTYAIILYMILGSAIGYIVGGVVGRKLVRTLTWIEDTIQNIPFADLVTALAGLVAGLAIAFFATLPLLQIQSPPLRLSIMIFVYVVLTWLGVKVGAGRGREFARILKLSPGEEGASRTPDKIIDTNIIIDGRILDIIDTGFIEGRLVLPRFVLNELHLIADSDDEQKRIRGRRGLDILNDLSTREQSIEIVEVDYPELRGVDAKLVRLASDTGAVLITNDYNLNKVAKLQGVKVLNIGDLANALKPVVIPGEEFKIKIVHKGKEAGQGVGYLEDGTMVVVEGAGNKIGKEVRLTITSMLQTSAGKMIFSKLKTVGVG